MAQIRQYKVADYEDVLLKVQELASIARSNYLAEEKKDSSCGLIDLSDIETGDYFEKRRQSDLFRFLNTLNEEQVKVVQAVMYIGRDYRGSEPTEDELEKYYERKAEDPHFELPEPSLRVANPDACLSEMIDDLGQVKNWKDKSIEIDTIMEKLMKLPDYLWRGFQVLGLQ